ncbi:MAG: ExbD/TolR family protein, partial [Pirellula sp.]
MALKPKFDAKAAEGDMTSMIDMVFQLIIFFMVLINFSQDDQNQAIKLPSSELAKPADAPLENPIVLTLAFNGKVYIGP